MTKISNHPHDKHHAVHHATSHGHHSATKKVSHSPNQHSLPHFHHNKTIHNADSATTIFERLKKITANQQHNKKQIRETVVEKLQHVLQHEGKLGRDIIVGFNSVQKKAESRSLAVIVIAKDSKESLVHMLVELAIIQKIPYLILPSFTSMLKEAFSINSCFCFAVPKESSVTTNSPQPEVTNEPDSEDVADQKLQQETSKAAAMDELRDFLVHLALTSAAPAS